MSNQFSTHSPTTSLLPQPTNLINHWFKGLLCYEHINPVYSPYNIHSAFQSFNRCISTLPPTFLCCLNQPPNPSVTHPSTNQPSNDLPIQPLIHPSMLPSKLIRSVSTLPINPLQFISRTGPSVHHLYGSLVTLAYGSSVLWLAGSRSLCLTTAGGLLPLTWAWEDLAAPSPPA